MEFFVSTAWIIPALPLAAFVLIWAGRSLGLIGNRGISMGLTVGATGLGLVWSLGILLWSLSGENNVAEKNFLWLHAGALRFSVGWIVDNLSAMMLVVVTTVSILVQIYTHGYMHDDEGYHRFYAFLALFNFSMLGLVLSTNLFQMYIFWELVGVSSYLLIGFWFKRPPAAAAAKKAFIMNRIGDFGFLVGIIAFLYFSLDWWKASGAVYLGFTALPEAAKHVHALASPLVFGLIGICIFLGAVAKSAQFPLHTWLPDAMEGPTPISALIHAATMVAAGVYLIARAYPIFELSHTVMSIIAHTGAITAIIAATIALTQVDIKRILAYSTCSQLGLMVMAMGAGVFSAGLFHLFTHAYFKAMLFLCSGAVIHGISGEQDINNMGGLRKHMPVVAITYLIGALALSGILLSGFWSKEEIFSGLAMRHQWLLLIVGLLVSGMTAFYMFRSYFVVFEGKYRGSAHPHNPVGVLTAPLVVLAIPSIIIGFALSGKLAGWGIGSFAGFVQPVEHEAAENGSLIIPVVSLAIGLGGITLAALFYWDKVRKFNPARLATALKPLYLLSFNKWYFDDIYNGIIRATFMPFSRFLSWFDKYIVDGLANLTGGTVAFSSRVMRLVQNGNVQVYALCLLGGFLFIAAMVIVIL